MTYTKFGTLVASVGVMTFALASHEASAGAAASRGAAVTAHTLPRPFFRHSFRRRHGNFFFPGVVGDTFFGSDGAPITEVTPPASSDVRYTSTFDVPWDWAHRFPPLVTPSDRPYVPGCTAESVTVPGRDGGEHTVNVTRCY